MLFGAGMILMADRAEARGARPAPIYYRRQFWLLVIGALHAYLIWFGDILFSYAAIGMLIYLLRRPPPGNSTANSWRGWRSPIATGYTISRCALRRSPRPTSTP